MEKELRPYQEQAVNAIDFNLKKGVKEQLVVIPTAGGKTFTCVKAIQNRGRILWIVTTEELCEQGGIALLSELNLMPYNLLLETIKRNGGLIDLLNDYKNEDFYMNEPIGLIVNNIGLIKADSFIIDKPIVLASAQTLYRRLERIPYDYFNVIVCDEADLFCSRTLRMPLDYFRHDLRLGLTATPYRQDNLPLDDIFGETVFEYSLRQAVLDGYLTKPIAIKVKTSANLDDVHTMAGEFNQKELTQKINTPERNYQIANKYIEYGQGRQFLAFCCDVQHAIDLCEAFKEKGVDCNYVVGDKELSPDRKKVIDSFKDGELLGLTNVMVLTCGFDHPDIGVIIMACPTKSKRKFIQQVGRGFRLKTDKFVEKYAQDIIILDIVDGSTKHKLINCGAIDAELELEDKIFISDSDRDKLRDAKLKREIGFVPLIGKDEIIELFPLPKIPRFKRSTDLASEAQLQRIKRLGYDIENNTYNQAQINDIFMNQPAPKEQVGFLLQAGFDVSNGVTVIEAQLAITELTHKNKKIKPTTNK